MKRFYVVFFVAIMLFSLIQLNQASAQSESRSLAGKYFVKTGEGRAPYSAIAFSKEGSGCVVKATYEYDADRHTSSIKEYMESDDQLLILTRTIFGKNSYTTKDYDFAWLNDDEFTLSTKKKTFHYKRVLDAPVIDDYLVKVMFLSNFKILQINSNEDGKVMDGYVFTAINNDDVCPYYSFSFEKGGNSCLTIVRRTPEGSDAHVDSYDKKTYSFSKGLLTIEGKVSFSKDKYTEENFIMIWTNETEFKLISNNGSYVYRRMNARRDIDKNYIDEKIEQNFKRETGRE